MAEALSALLITACHTNQPLGPPIPTGAVILGGKTMPPPSPPPGWKLQTVAPTSQQQAQDTVLAYLKKTLDALPAGTVFDSHKYFPGITAPCTDAPLNTNPPVDFSATGDLILPPGVENGEFIARVGEIWKSWGWWVYERDGMYKPNRAGLPPDGYELFIEVPAIPGPPHITGLSPCFPADLQRGDIPFPRKLTAG